MGNSEARSSRLTHNLGHDDVEIVRLEATEGLSQPFYFELDLFSERTPLDLLPNLGTEVTVSAYDGDDLLRHFHGVAVDGTFLHQAVNNSTGEPQYFYRLTLRPRSFLYEHNRRYRLFDKTPTRKILQTVLDGCGIPLEMSKLEGGNAVRPYCVQYGESDFGFACRLMEEEGIYYYYEHTDDQHTLMLCDSPAAHKVGSASPLTYNPSMDVDADATGETLFVTRWQERVSTGAEKTVRLRDHDFTQSRTIKAEFSADKPGHTGDNLEVDQYPGRYYDEEVGKTKAQALLESRRAGRQIFTGESDAVGVCCGATFALESHGIDRYNASYLVTQTRHGIATETYRSSMGFEGDDGVWFEAVPADVRWRAPMTSRRPVVMGPETAIVVGEGGDNEVETDEYGRVKVLFHWDLKGENERNFDTYCWIRVSQIGHLGSIVLPRIGQEVLVDFINGDPDRPIIVGRLFNKDHKPLYKLAEHKSRATWRSQTMGASDGSAGTYQQDEGGWLAPGGNEITMEDKPGAEELVLRAERAMNTYVTENYKREVYKDEIVKVTGDQTIDVQKNIKIDAGETIEITAQQKITLTCGQSKITMTQSDITIESTTIKIEGMTGVQVKSIDTKVNGDAMLTLKGGMVLINS